MGVIYTKTSPLQGEKNHWQILFHWNVLLPLEMNILNKKNRITNKISSLIYDIGGVSNKTTFSHISPKMPACVDTNQQSGGVCYNGECVHQYFTAFFMYFRGKKRHFKIKCNRAPLFFFLCRPKIFKFPGFFSILKLVNRQLASIYFA